MMTTISSRGDEVDWINRRGKLLNTPHPPLTSHSYSMYCTVQLCSAVSCVATSDQRHEDTMTHEVKVGDAQLPAPSQDRRGPNNYIEASTINRIGDRAQKKKTSIPRRNDRPLGPQQEVRTSF